MPVWLITGATGFLGRHVLAALGEWRTSGVEVVTLGRRCPPRGTFQTFLKADLDDPASVHRAIGVAAPAVVLHLAGQTPPASPEQFYRVNTLATVHLLDALRARGGAARVVLAGSAAELGPVELADLPVGEDHPCRPSESYGLSKLLATAAGLAARPPLEVIAARIFNPIGPGQPPSQAFGRFAARLAEGDPMPLSVGDLDIRRDFIDARDVARALIALAESGRAGSVYHVGTGRSRCVREGLDHLIRLSGRAVEVKADPRASRNAGPRDSCADIRRIAADTAWRPRVAWEQSLADLWDEARSRSRLPLTA